MGLNNVAVYQNWQIWGVLIKLLLQILSSSSSAIMVPTMFGHNEMEIWSIGGVCSMKSEVGGMKLNFFLVFAWQNQLSCQKQRKYLCISLTIFSNTFLHFIFFKTSSPRDRSSQSHDWWLILALAPDDFVLSPWNIYCVVIHHNAANLTVMSTSEKAEISLSRTWQKTVRP